MRYEIQQWITGFAIRDTLEDVYIRNWGGEVVMFTLSEAAETCLNRNTMNQESKWEAYFDAMRCSQVDADTFDDDPYAYEDDDYPGYEEDCQAMRYGQVDADDYAAQQR
jgi:hypothetical protein